MWKDGCRVVEYYYVESEPGTLVKLTDGRVVWDDEIPEGARIATGDDGKPVRRKDTRRRVYCAHSNGVEWLRKPEELPTDDIPIVTVLGERLLVEGQFRVKGMVADLIEAQRMFNFNSSAIAETMALGARANWLATVEQIEPFMELWRSANSRNVAVLPYHNVPGVGATSEDLNGASDTRDERGALQSESDLRSISWRLRCDGATANNVSGVGESDPRATLANTTGNVNWAKHLAVGVKRTADILLKYFPVIYDTGA
jgi:hypothetical protein